MDVAGGGVWADCGSAAKGLALGMCNPPQTKSLAPPPRPKWGGCRVSRHPPHLPRFGPMPAYRDPGVCVGVQVGQVGGDKVGRTP